MVDIKTLKSCLDVIIRILGGSTHTTLFQCLGGLFLFKFAFIKNNDNVLYNLHEVLNIRNRDVEVFQLVDGE